MNRVYIVAHGGVPSYVEWSVSMSDNRNIYIGIVDDRTLDMLKDESGIKITKVQLIF